MQRKVLQVIIILLLASIFLSGFLLARHILHLPFRPTNDALHQKKSAFTLDFLIPSGTYLDETITIGEVIKIRFIKEKTPYQRYCAPFSISFLTDTAFWRIYSCFYSGFSVS